MEPSQYFKDYRSLTTFKPDRCSKTTLFEDKAVLVGLNCLEPGQSYEKHAHKIQNRFYLALEGQGLAWVGEEKMEIGEGMIVWVPAGLTHRIENTGAERMVLLIGIAPAHAD